MQSNRQCQDAGTSRLASSDRYGGERAGKTPIIGLMQYQDGQDSRSMLSFVDAADLATRYQPNMGLPPWNLEKAVGYRYWSDLIYKGRLSGSFPGVFSRFEDAEIKERR